MSSTPPTPPRPLDLLLLPPMTRPGRPPPPALPPVPPLYLAPPPPPPTPSVPTPLPQSQQPASNQHTTSAIARLHVHALERIAAFLNERDCDCLGMTCRGFRNVLTPHLRHQSEDHVLLRRYFAPDGNAPNIPPWRQLFHKRLEYAARFWRPGNIFYNRDLHICIFCLKVRPLSRYPIYTFRIDNQRVCDDCHFRVFGTKFPGGHKLSYRGDDWYTCTHCQARKLAKDMHAHRDYWDGGKALDHFRRTPCMDEFQRLCARCHARVCGDLMCAGWPPSDFSATGALLGFVEMFAEE